MTSHQEPRHSSSEPNGATMPYLVTTWKQCPEGHPEPLAQGDGSGYDGAGNYHTPPCEVCDDRCEVVEARRAFATLDDENGAREAACSSAAEVANEHRYVLASDSQSTGVEPPEYGPSDFYSLVSEQGGHIELPGGRTVEVAPIDRAWLIDHTPRRDWPLPTGRLIVIFNEAQARDGL